MNEPVNKTAKQVAKELEPQICQAVEGSMQKRQDLIDRVAVNKQLDDLVKKIRWCYYYVDYHANKTQAEINADIETVVEEAKQSILDLIASEKRQSFSEGAESTMEAVRYKMEDTINSEKVKELEQLLSNVPMPSLSYEQVQNRIKTIKENTK